MVGSDYGEVGAETSSVIGLLTSVGDGDFDGINSRRDSDAASRPLSLFSSPNSVLNVNTYMHKYNIIIMHIQLYKNVMYYGYGTWRVCGERGREIRTTTFYSAKFETGLREIRPSTRPVCYKIQ